MLFGSFLRLTGIEPLQWKNSEKIRADLRVLILNLLFYSRKNYTNFERPFCQMSRILVTLNKAVFLVSGERTVITM